MKKYFKYILFGSLIASSTACNEDFIDLEPTNVLASNLTFQTMADVELQLIGTYQGMVNGSYMSTNLLIVPDIISDNATQTSDNQGQQVFYHNHQYAANDQSILGTWSRLYITIERANITLEESENFEEEYAGQRAEIQGQAYALRALAHFDLLRLYADRFDQTSALGIPIKTVSRTIEGVDRSTIGEVLTQINSDLGMARTLLAANEPTDTDNKIGIDAANAISARVALYSYQYQSAIDFATAVIGTKSLASGTDFTDIWTLDTDGTSDELIWSLAYTAADAGVGNGIWNQPADLLFWAPSQSLLGMYDQVNDARYGAYFQTRPSDAAIIVDAKYRGRAPGGTISNFGLNNVKMFRLSEMFLIRAEAEVELNGNSAAAAADLNAIRAARVTGHTDEVFTDAAVLETAIQNERRKELAFEGHRWFDLKRRREAIVRGSDCDTSPAVSCSLANDNFRWIWPIPQDEIFANPMTQNDGY